VQDELWMLLGHQSVRFGVRPAVRVGHDHHACIGGQPM